MKFDAGNKPSSVFSAQDVDELRPFSTALIGDELGRRNIMHSRLRPRSHSARFAGPAFTVECIAGNIVPIPYALEKIAPGEVMVIDARGFQETAVWGEIMQTTAIARKVAAVIIDGSVRDTSFLAQSELPIFSSGICPRGPQTIAGGSILQEIQCGGVVVAPGDLIIGDGDGILVVKPEQIAGLKTRCEARQAFEDNALRIAAAGGSICSALGLPASSSD